MNMKNANQYTKDDKMLICVAEELRKNQEIFMSVGFTKEESFELVKIVYSAYVNPHR